VYGYVQFDSFMLDAALEGSALQVSSAGGFITITWNDYPGAILQSTASLNSANWQPVSATPIYTTGLASVTLPVSSAANMFFRLAQAAP
jgi:hypothetical protein